MKNFVVLGLLIGGLLATGGCGNGATFAPVPPPTFESLTPTLGSLQGGTHITITGTGFMPDTTVQIGEVDVVNLVVVDETTMTCETPPHPGGTNAGIQLTNVNGTAIALGQFFYIPPPTLTSLSPNTGQPPGGVQTTLSGTGFTAFDAGTNIVTFGGLPATDVVTVNDTTIRCIVPPGAGPVTVIVTNNNGTATLDSGYRYFPPPTLSFVTPGEGTPLGGSDVIVKGTGFEANSPGDPAITFGGVAATNIVVVNDTTITCTTPAGPPGSVDVAITNLNGGGTLPNGFTFYPHPTVTLVDPPGASYEGGVPATITGTGYVANAAGNATVTFAGIEATNVVIVNDTTITCVTPATSVGPVTVAVTNDNGTGSLDNAITIELDGLFGTAGTQLFKINPSTGATTPIGSGIGYTPNAIAIDDNGTIFGITNTDLISIDPVTGAGSVVAGLSPAPASPINELTFQGDGTLVGVASQGWQAANAPSYTVDTTDGTITAKGFLQSPDGNTRRGVEFDGTQLVYLRGGYNNSNPLPVHSFNLDSGATSQFSSLSNVHCGVAAGRYNGTIFVVNSAANTFGAEDTLSLYTANASWSTGTYVGDLPSGMTTISGTGNSSP